MELIVPDLRQGYVDVVQSVLKHGTPRVSRGYKTWNVKAAAVVIEDPTRVIPVGVGRHPRPEIGAAEALLLCGGLESSSLLCSVSSSFRRFLDAGGHHGCYGRRVRPQMETLVNRLRADKGTRQAVLHVYDPLYDQITTRDLPCTLCFGFEIDEHDELHVHATMRSNDAILGLCYDAFQFAQLGHTVGNVLGIRFASLTINQYSLHLYERNLDMIGALHDYDGEELDEPRGFGQIEDGPDLYGWLSPVPYETARSRAEAVYNGELIEGETESERWFRETLAPYDRLTRIENFRS